MLKSKMPYGALTLAGFVLVGACAWAMLSVPATVLPPVDVYARTQIAKMASLTGKKARIEQRLAMTTDPVIRLNLQAHLRVLQSGYTAPLN